MAGLPDHQATVEFGRFKVVRHRRELLVDDRPVELGGRAFDTLVALIDARGTVVSKDDLMRRVWPDRVVEENNLQAQIVTLRKAFGADRDLIRTVAGRGYQFTGELRAAAPAAPPARSTNLPEAVSELIGREAELADVTNLIRKHRLVTLVGAGGIGKTRLGLEVARHLLGEFSDGVFVAELAPLSGGELVPARVATALGLTVVAGAVSREGVAAAVGSRRLLLVLDNCEHLIEAAAGMVEALLHANPSALLLATSREPLRADGEYVYRVPPLAVPAEDDRDMDDVMRHGAVRLFVSRAQAAEPRYVPDARLVKATATICRRLDGIPLAIELAAARIAAFGVEGVAARLDDRFRLLAGGNRTALPRHQTLRATLDWSHELLSESERVVLRRLAIFAGVFTLEAAVAVATSIDVPAPEVVDCVANLVAKSLVSADVAGAIVHDRLLDTTRAYAREKLVESGELERCARRHAEYYRDLFERADVQRETRPIGEWLADYGRQIDNLRAALDWAFSAGGDAATGVALTTAAVPLWFSLSLLDECRARVESALATVGSGAPTDPRRQMQLHAALGWSLMYTRGPARATGAAWATALELAERLDDIDYRLRALWGLWASRINNAEFETALALAKQFVSLAEKGDRRDQPIGDRMLGASLHFLGNQTDARRHITRMLERYVTPANRSDVVRFQFDQRVTARITLARILWLQGSADQAMRTVGDTIDDARSINHALSLCNALAQAACPLALYAGDLDAAERFTALLLDETTRHALDVWNAYGRCFKGTLLVKRGDVGAGLGLLGPAVDELREAQFVQYETAFLGWLAEGFAAAGQTARGLTAIGEALARAESTHERWAMAELLRIRGELLLVGDEPKAAVAAEDHFRQALDWARRQEALSWELRSAVSLARLWHRQHRTGHARKLLAPVYARFSEGFGTADLLAAKALLASLK